MRLSFYTGRRGRRPLQILTFVSAIEMKFAIGVCDGTSRRRPLPRFVCFGYRGERSIFVVGRGLAPAVCLRLVFMTGGETPPLRIGSFVLVIAVKFAMGVCDGTSRRRPLPIFVFVFAIEARYISAFSSGEGGDRFSGG